MRVVLQRVKGAQVSVANEVVGQIKNGILIFLGVAQKDSMQQADWLIKKIVELRIFEDKNGKMNLSALEMGAQFLVVSQFTLYGNCDQGRRPSFDEAAGPLQGEELYNYFVKQLKKHNVVVETGRFRAMMEVSLVNDGPVTFILDSHADH
ncbi:MAG: D-tyrosyl-tRNA(Tyr) deacylase [Candidatus Omnitrophica bacterium]|nr:D-tyrosyl-tRNA(Tyr) deacylase [Candidatus Omnitrophota bacterium]